MIPVIQTETSYRRPTSNMELLLALDNGEPCYVVTLLTDGYSDEDRARWGLYLAEEFSLPEGWRTTSEERFELVEGIVKQVFDIEEIPPPPVLTDREKVMMIMDAIGVTILQFKAVLEAEE